jgi:mono/diheme cytochrome c family protein
MRRVAPLIVVTLGAAAFLSGCGSQGVVAPVPATVIGTLPKATAEPATPAFKLKGDPVAGKQVFETAGCKSCHTLADAGAKGTIGPNLDEAKPDYRLVTARVTFGKGVMPSFKGQLSTQQIANVAAYVVKATGGTPP